MCGFRIWWRTHDSNGLKFSMPMYPDYPQNCLYLVMVCWYSSFLTLLQVPVSKALSWHYNDVIMSAMVSQIAGASIVYSTVCSGSDQRKHQSSASLAFVRGIHRWPVNSSHKGPVTRKMFPFDDVIMTTNCRSWSTDVRIPLAPTTKIRMARVTLSFDLLAGKWSSPMGYICATNEYNPWNRRRHNWMTLRIKAKVKCHCARYILSC